MPNISRTICINPFLPSTSSRILYFLHIPDWWWMIYVLFSCILSVLQKSMCCMLIPLFLLTSIGSTFLDDVISSKPSRSCWWCPSSCWTIRVTALVYIYGFYFVQIDIHLLGLHIISLFNEIKDIRILDFLVWAWWNRNCDSFLYSVDLSLSLNTSTNYYLWQVELWKSMNKIVVSPNYIVQRFTVKLHNGSSAIPSSPPLQGRPVVLFLRAHKTWSHILRAPRKLFVSSFKKLFFCLV